LVLNPGQYQDIPLDYILKRLKEFKGWIDGVCITGGEPTLQPSLPQLAESFKEEGFLVKIDTNGTHPEVLRFLKERGLIDHVSMDVKSPLNEIQYSRCAGVPVNLEKIRESIQWLKGENLPYEFRITVVPTLLKEEDLYLLARELKNSHLLTLQNFNPSDPLDPKLKSITPYTASELSRIQKEVSKILKDGLNIIENHN
jgi:pyruvate formate lyase activating enzyme